MLIMFSQISAENKITINRILEEITPHPLLQLEKWVDSPCYFKRQVGFCAQWCLDNICK